MPDRSSRKCSEWRSPTRRLERPEFLLMSRVLAGLQDEMASFFSAA
jgi:hypothetical protein